MGFIATPMRFPPRALFLVPLALLAVRSEAAGPVTDSVGIDLVPIPAGHFLMGQDARQTDYRAPWRARGGAP